MSNPRKTTYKLHLTVVDCDGCGAEIAEFTAHVKGRLGLSENLAFTPKHYCVDCCRGDCNDEMRHD